MENQSNNNGRKPPQPKQRVFGANTIHLSEENASKLMGGIVEKGISSSSDTFTTPSTSSSPLPSPLAFPVARHRSHGPHWTPASQIVAGGAIDALGNYDDDAEENCLTNYEPLAEFAKPIKKKEKKGLDLSKWKETIRTNNVSKIQEKDNNKSMREVHEQQMVQEHAITDTDMNSFDNESSMDIDIEDSLLERSPNSDVDLGLEKYSSTSTNMVTIRDKNPSSSFGSISVGYDQGHTDLESQIHAENRAVLERMSPQEISEAQADIRNRINPELLNLLKKRGIKKLAKKGSSDLCPNGVDIMDDKHAEKIEDEVELSAQESTLRPGTQTKQILQTRPDEDIVQNSVSKSNSVWSAWSERVEAVRNLRFSLDGNVVEGYSLGSTYSADNVAERDFLRTEGDPGAAGYTIKEALTLARSVVPGQRAFALHLLASVLNNAMNNICKSELEGKTKISSEMNLVDWEAIWAYALGPEPELALSMRLVIDDNHTSVILASARVIQCILACDLNEKFFNTTMKLARIDMYTAPVFRIRPDVKHGFFRGGFWKYSSKPSNIILHDEVMNDKNEGERTIKDDNVIACQDVASGLVRMEILPRLLYLLETGPTTALEQCILSILIAIARHSPTCANAIWKCERLVQTIVERFDMKDTLEFQGGEVKSMTLLRVLAQSSKIICVEIINRGFFHVVTQQLYRITPSIKEWVRFGREKCKLASELLVEQLRLWKVCIVYGRCISSFTGFFPALCLWLNPPTLDMLTEINVFNEFASVTTEIFLVLETLADRLPNPYSSNAKNRQFLDVCGDNVETWCWNDVCPMVDSALQWLELTETTLLKFYDQIIGVDSKFVDHNTSASSSSWILSAVMHFLQTVLKKATPMDTIELKGSANEKLMPQFVAKLSLQIIKSGIFDFSDQNEDGMSSLIDKLCNFRHKSDPGVSLSSVWCLNTLVRLLVSTERFIHQTLDKFGPTIFEECEFGSGILNASFSQWRKVVGEFMNIVTSGWELMCQVEVFGRGGPAPGVGVGWGALTGGFWSSAVVTFQADARLLTELLESWIPFFPMDFHGEEDTFSVKIINSALASSLMMGPGDKMILQKIFDILLQVPVLKYIDQQILCFLRSYHGKEPLRWENKDDELMQLSNILTSHFTHRWLDVKKKKKPEMKDGDQFRSKKINGVSSLATISEDVETSDVVTMEDSSFLMVEWARQRMPLPVYWLLSPMTTISNINSNDPEEFLQVTRAGLFLLLGSEAISFGLPDEDGSPIRSIPLIWKLHSLSVPLLVGMGVLEEEKSRNMYEALQSLYGRYLDELCETETSEKDDLSGINCLKFKTEIHENYSTFIEALVEQFAAVSYGDVIFGRQIAIYLHQKVETSVRLATWNALSNASVLELLPPLDKCISRAEGYLQPVEDDDSILEAFVKSWVSGSLDRSALRGSMSYTIAVHHLSSFILNSSDGERSLLRNKLVKSLLRDYSRKRQHETMMLNLIRCNQSNMILKSEQTATGPRLELLKEACEGNLQLLREVHKLECAVTNKQSTS